MGERAIFFLCGMLFCLFICCTFYLWTNDEGFLYILYILSAGLAINFILGAANEED
jgi:hypothetical protein